MTSLEMVACECDVCKRACTYRPGWFLPGQVARAAELAGMSEQDFFDKYVGVDYWEGQPLVFVLAPATDRMMPGSEYPYDPIGTCTFFKGGKCSIHAAKPHECAFYDHGKTKEVCSLERDKVREAWEKNQAEIERLLGRPPHVDAPNPFDALQLLANMLNRSCRG